MLASNSSPALVHISRYEYPEGARLLTHILRRPASNFDCVVLCFFLYFFVVVRSRRRGRSSRLGSAHVPCSHSFTLCLSRNAVSFVSYMPCINLSPKHCLIEGIFFDWGFVCASALSPAACTLTHVDANRCSSHCHTLRASLRLTRLTSPT